MLTNFLYFETVEDEKAVLINGSLQREDLLCVVNHLLTEFEIDYTDLEDYLSDENEMERTEKVFEFVNRQYAKKDRLRL